MRKRGINRSWLFWSSSHYLRPHHDQISPAKSMNFPYTIAAFTILLNPSGHRNVAHARPEVQPYMLFLSVDS